MKKKPSRILAAVLYGFVLCALLFFQYQSISGAWNRALANGAALLLALLSLPAFWLYLKAGHAAKTSDDAAAGERGPKDAPSQSTSPAGFAPSPEERRPFVYAYLRDKNLSPRETEVAWLIYRGYTNMQIGEELYISETTVKKHASHIYEKMEVSGRKALREDINRRGFPGSRLDKPSVSP